MSVPGTGRQVSADYPHTSPFPRSPITDKPRQTKLCITLQQQRVAEKKFPESQRHRSSN